MAITKTQLDTELEAAKTAIAAGSYQTAKVELTKARITLAGLPNYSIAGRRLEYRNEINELFSIIDDLSTNTTTNRKYRRVFAKATRE